MKLRNFLSANILAVSVMCVCLPLAYAETPVPAADGAKPAATEEQAHRLVIQVNQRAEDAQDHILSNIVNLQKYYGIDNIEMEVVAYGPGIWLVTEKSAFIKRVESLMMQNVTFTACGNTLDTVEMSSGSRPKLLDGVEETQAGIARIIHLQEQGWSYLSP
jgi:hypothetical protein